MTASRFYRALALSCVLVLQACRSDAPRSAHRRAAVPFSPRCDRDHVPRPDRDPNPMCWIPAAVFMMGPSSHDNPAHRVRITHGFYLDEIEVTVGQYARFLRARGHNTCLQPNEDHCLVDGAWLRINVTDPRFPVDPGTAHEPVLATLEGARAYCEWVGKRLPTEAEWELAARHDPTTGEDHVFPWGDVFEPHAANAGDDIEEAHMRAPRTFPRDRSPTGAYDMVGNAEEWVADCYRADPSCGSDVCVDPLISTDCEESCGEDGLTGQPILCETARTVRGGNAGMPTEWITMLPRTLTSSGISNGFRCAAP
jgi:formylglycine-generating enzyme required for sulfatase activity